LKPVVAAVFPNSLCSAPMSEVRAVSGDGDGENGEEDEADKDPVAAVHDKLKSV
jgi:hypothetical protein